MSDPQVDRWRQKGSIYLWRFKDDLRNHPGLNCTADHDGCSSMIELLTLMTEAKWSSKKKVALAEPTEAIARVPGGHIDLWTSSRYLSLVYPMGKVAESFWEWSGSLENPALTVGASKLMELRDAFKVILSGIGDFCIHAEGQKLHGFDFESMSIWFWGKVTA